MKLSVLICEGDQLSLGRISFWIVFGLSIYFWLLQPVAAFPPTLYETLLLTLGYNLTKKGIDTYKNIKMNEIFERQTTLFDTNGSIKRKDINMEDK